MTFFCSGLPKPYKTYQLTAEDAEVLSSHWAFSGKGSVNYIKYNIGNFPSVGIKDEKGNLVAWELSYFTGAMGMLHVMEEHRKKGIAKFIICTLASKLLDSGKKVYCFIEDDNKASLDLHLKCGFHVPPNSQGFFAKCIKGTSDHK